VRAAVLTDIGGLDRLTVADVPDPGSPGPGQVRVAIRAAALNHLDLFVAGGLPGVAYQFPHIVGADGAGVIEAVGAGVTRVKAGDRVMINPGISDRICEFCRAGEQSLCIKYRILGEHLNGTICQSIVLPEFNVAAIPALTPALSWAEAAAFSLVTLTAWRMVTTRAHVKAGEWVLVWGIGGGVSLTALRIAKHMGATVIATSSSDAKLARARELIAAAPQLAPPPPHPPQTGTCEDTILPQDLDHPCPHCACRMVIIETFERGCRPRHRPSAPATIGINSS